MQNWDYMTVQVCLDASSCVYTVVCTGDQGIGDERSLSDFLRDMSKQGWEYVDLNNNLVTLKRLKQK